MASVRQEGYKTLRFKWKRAVNAAEELSRGAKHMAVFLCDNYVNKHTGRCWPKNQTVAQKTHLSVRTVQRHIGELKQKGWLQLVTVRGAHRAFLIAFPQQAIVDSFGDNLTPTNMTKLTSKYDVSVTPYKNQVDNKEYTSGISTVSVGFEEELILQEWASWFAQNTSYEAKTMFDLLRTKCGYQFPARYPKEDETRRYQAFFSEVVATQGRIVPGKVWHGH